MWIIPRNHQLYYLYAPDTVDSKEELSELSDQLESSLMWRSKPSQLRTWLTRWSRAKWFRHLCGRTLKPSQWDCFETRLTSLLEDIPASRFQQQVSGWEKTIRDISGPTSEKSSGKFDPGCVSLRMLKDIFPKDSTQFSVIWKKMVTAHRGEYSVRLKSARLINGNGSSSWPTACSRDHKDSGPNVDWEKVNKKHKLSGAVMAQWAAPNAGDGKAEMNTKGSQKRLGKDVTNAGLADPESNNTNGKSRESSNWTTPCADNTGARKKKYAQGGTALSMQANWLTPRSLEVDEEYDNYRQRMVKSGNPKNVGKVNPANLTMQTKMNWPTAKTSDAEGGRIKTEQTEDGFRSLRSKSNQWFGAKLRDATEMEKPKSVKLNPDWVEQLMGLPVGWSQLLGETDNRVDRLRLLGNGVVPQTAEKAFKTLLGR